MTKRREDVNISELRSKIDKNLTKSNQLFKYIEHFVVDLSYISPDNEHHGAHVKHVNGSFSYGDFWNEFGNSLSNIVFGDKVKPRTDELEREGSREPSAAAQELFKQASRHFTAKNNQGKIGEAFLFFFIEKVFDACRIGSKFQLSMPHDQQKGSDAVHMGVVDEQPCFYLGEAKFYKKLDGALGAALDSLKSHRESEVLEAELKWLKTTEAAYSDFKTYLDDLGSYEYKIRQVAFILLKGDTVDPSKIKERIEECLEKEFKNQKISEKWNDHPFKDELHLILFLLPQYPDAHEEFQKIFEIEITPPRSQGAVNDSL